MMTLIVGEEERQTTHDPQSRFGYRPRVSTPSPATSVKKT